MDVELKESEPLLFDPSEALEDATVDVKDDLWTSRDDSSATRDGISSKASFIKTIIDVHGGIEEWLKTSLEDAIPKDLYSMYINKNNILFAFDEPDDDSRQYKWVQEMTESCKRSILASFDTVTHYTNLTCRSEAHRKRIAFDYKTDPAFLRIVEPKSGRCILSNLIKCAVQQHKGLINYVDYVRKNIASMPLLEELNRFALTQKIAYKAARERLWFIIGLAEQLKLVESGKTFKRAPNNAKDGMPIDRVSLDKELTLKWFKRDSGKGVQEGKSTLKSAEEMENAQKSSEVNTGGEPGFGGFPGLSSSLNESCSVLPNPDVLLQSSSTNTGPSLLQNSSMLQEQLGMSDTFMDNSVSFLADGNISLLGNESVPILADASMSILANDSVSLFVDKNNEPVSGFTSLGIGELSTPNAKNTALLNAKRNVDSFDDNFMNLMNESPASFFRLDQLSDQTKNSLNDSQGTSWQALQMMKKTKNKPEESKGKHTMKEVLDKFVKKKANYAFKNAISTISVLEAACKLYGKGPKWCNPNKNEFDTSNKDRKLVYVMPSKAVKPNDLAYQYLMQYASVHQKLNGGIRQEHAILYGIITMDSAPDANQASAKSFKVNADPWHDKRFIEKWSKLSISINGYTPWIIKSHVLMDDKVPIQEPIVESLADEQILSPDEEVQPEATMDVQENGVAEVADEEDVLDEVPTEQPSMDLAETVVEVEEQPVTEPPENVHAETTVEIPEEENQHDQESPVRMVRRNIGPNGLYSSGYEIEETQTSDSLEACMEEENPKNEPENDPLEKKELETMETLSTHCPDEEVSEPPRIKLERDAKDDQEGTKIPPTDVDIKTESDKKNYDAPGPVKIQDTGMKQMKLTHLFRYVYTKIKKTRPLPECSPELLGLSVPKEEPARVEHASPIFGKRRRILDDDHVPDVLASDYVKIATENPTNSSQDSNDGQEEAEPAKVPGPEKADTPTFDVTNETGGKVDEKSQEAAKAAFMAKFAKHKTAQEKKANRRERIHQMREIMKSMIEYEAVESDDENLSDPEDIKRSLELLKNRLLHSSDESDSEPESETEIAMEMRNFIQEVENINEEDEEIARQRFYEDMKAKEDNELAKLMAFKEKGEREMTRREERMKLLMELKKRRRSSTDDLHLSDFESSSDEQESDEEDGAPRLSKKEIKHLLGFKDKGEVKLSQTDELERFIDFKLQNLPQPIAEEESNVTSNLGNVIKSRRDMMDNMFSSGFDSLFSNVDPDYSSSVPLNPFGSSALNTSQSFSNTKSPKKNSAFVMKSFRWDQSQKKPLNSTNIRNFRGFTGFHNIAATTDQVRGPKRDGTF
ncbi:hypothetical protein BEWA_029550 [Theileria equi strain WA]|uniref:Uncharacterized protein n=1 Tax=Theileria equi strain WA TaxID=1537102 RepID=L0AX19_THEEQ|nr:hypothetical protein BEWA_029550 [Theileria equi strain WA]AFZ80105.1 hypothetical protein BEWA_029550 [Theileria equi strain WA]|eukprot:XP_004829771.1 hypothetical protein BEWA_029550 [Theileria equi strain WA]